ncbi:MAG TPA: SIS domain-containing protein [Pseudonocardiaceae bacterium]|nr:SIS domain-containing protein [Pseudonocardiaceae bacterium]
MLDDSLLDDAQRLASADGRAGGCLRAVASAGAQVRATVETSAEIGIDQLAGNRPRALIIVTRPGVAPAVAQLLLALLPANCPVPIVLSEDVPSWVGPLDVLLIHSDDPGDHALAASIDRARRFGATLVVTAADEGPVAAAAAGTLLLPPRIDLPSGFGYPRALATGLIVLDTLGLLRTDVGNLADELDREAERDHANFESFVNPAKSLALRMADRTPLLCGLDPVAAAVAWHAAEVLAGFAGIVASHAGYPQVCTRRVLYRAAIGASAGADIFADPDDVVPGGTRVLLLSITDDPQAIADRIAATDDLPGADLLQPAEETTGGAAVRAAVLALRFEMASVYLGLASGMLGGSGRYEPVSA